MSLYNIPFLNGKKTLIAGYGLLIAGAGGLLTAFGGCLQHLDVYQCYQDVSAAYDPFLAALMGLGFIGVGHKHEKAGA
jgi:hypothetical protein